MIEIYAWNDLSSSERARLLARAPGGDGDVTRVVADVVADVRTRGDAAVREYSAKFDKYEGALERVSAEALDAALAAQTPELKAALTEAIANVTAFHKAQKPQDVRVETQPGITCDLVWRPIERVGLYIPGGTAPLLSTLVMCAVPAVLAGCSRIFLCTPPTFEGGIRPGILATARLCGVDEIYPVGGAQAIAAMGFGTQSLPKADKIFGPGNAYVTRAKQLVAEETGGAAIDMPAGPSEVMVIATAGSNPRWIAADLLAQAEHGRDSQSILLTTDPALAQAVKAEVARQADLLPRKEILVESLRYSRIFVVADLETALEIANSYAPEHLILQNGMSAEADEEAAAWVERVRTAGSVFVGAYAAETGGDYATGTNHVLPTYGHARAYGGLNLLSFMRSMTVQKLTRDGFNRIAPTLVTLAQAESLDAHAAAVTLRMEETL